MKRIILGILLVIISLFLVACEGVDLSGVSDEDLERISGAAVVCNEPYIRFGTSCCMDKNDNNVCDNDEFSGERKPRPPISPDNEENKEKDTPETGTISLDEAEARVLEYVNSKLLQPPFIAKVVGSEEDGGLYKITLEVAGQTVESYVTKNGKFFFPQGFDLDLGEPKEETKKEPIDEELPEEETDEQTHYVNFADDGFSPSSITINLGDIVVWKNQRSGGLSRAMVIGTEDCRRVRSGILEPGDRYSYTFTEPGTCVIVDGIYVTKSMKVKVRGEVEDDPIITNYQNVAVSINQLFVDWKGTWGKITKLDYTIKNKEKGTIKPSYFMMSVEGYDSEADKKKIPLPISSQKLKAGETLSGIINIPNGFAYHPSVVGNLNNVQISVILYDANDKPMASFTKEFHLEGVEDEPIPEETPDVEFTIDAKKWIFIPHKITVNEGDLVRLTIVPKTDLSFTFSIPEFDVEKQISKKTAVNFIAKKPGVFKFECSSCKEWRGMTGTIEVIPKAKSELEDDDTIFGQDDAPVTIVEFSDYECPFCARFYSETFSLINEKYVQTGKVKFISRDFPLSFHPNAQKAAEAAECAGEQEKFWQMHHKLFSEGVGEGIETFKRYAEEIGLNTDEFNVCLDSSKMESEVLEDFRNGQEAGVLGVPAFFINGRMISGAQPFSVFEQMIEEELN